MHHNLHYLNFSGQGKHWYRWWRTNFVYSRGKPWFCCRCYYHRCRNNYIQTVQIISYFWNLKLLMVKTCFVSFLFNFVCVLHSFIFNFDWSLIMNLIVYPSNKTINQTLKQKHPLRIIWSHFQHKMIVLFSIFLCFKIYQWIV